MFRRGHFPLDRVPRFGAEPSSIAGEERAELADHLSTGCRRCWSAVSALTPGSVRISCDPMANALSLGRAGKTPVPLDTDAFKIITSLRPGRHRRLLAVAAPTLLPAFLWCLCESSRAVKAFRASRPSGVHLLMLRSYGTAARPISSSPVGAEWLRKWKETSAALDGLLPPIALVDPNKDDGDAP